MRIEYQNSLPLLAMVAMVDSPSAFAPDLCIRCANILYKDVSWLWAQNLR
jgi:hypothetical protein